MFKKLVMPFIAKNVNVPEKVLGNNSNDLSLEELQFILLLIRDSSFKGENVQVVYNTVLKLQNQYTTLQNIKK